MAYSDAERAEALICLARHKYNFTKAAKELGLPVMTLRRWNKNVPKKGVTELLTRAIEQMLVNVPTKWMGNDWAIAVGILIDKWLLAQGLPTARTESIARRVGQLSDDEYYNVVEEAERILAEAQSHSVPAGDVPEPGGAGAA